MAKSAFEFLKELGYSETKEEKIYLDALGDIAAELLVYRKKNNLTQQQLAEKLGISQVMVSKIESGMTNISVKTLAKIAAKLNGSLTISLNIVNDEINNDEYKTEFEHEGLNDHENQYSEELSKAA